MTRGYAIRLGAGTQVLTHLPWFVLAEGKPGERPRAMTMGAGWAVNVIVAEWIIRRGATRPRRAAATVIAGAVRPRRGPEHAAGAPAVPRRMPGGRIARGSAAGAVRAAGRRQ